MPNDKTFNQQEFNQNGSLERLTTTWPSTKRYFYKVYNASGIYQATWHSDVISDPTYRMVINGGAGEMKISLARKYDNFGDGVDVAVSNRVDCYCADTQAPNGVKIYSGYISQYNPVIDGDKEYIEVTCLGFVTLASFNVVKDGTGSTYLTYSGTDPSQMAMDVVNKAMADGVVGISFNAGTIDLTNTTQTYTFNVNTLKECLDKILEFTPANWYWFHNPTDNNVYVKLANMNTPTHVFAVGKNIQYLETVKRVEDVYNQVYVVGGGGGQSLFARYTRNGSVTLYGKREFKISDGRVTDLSTADAMAKRLLDMKQSPEIRSIIRIADNNGDNPLVGYDIESIHPGDTCQVKNLNYGVTSPTAWDVGQWDVSPWDYPTSYQSAVVMLIVSVTYYPNYVEIEASSRFPEVSRTLNNVDGKVNQTISNNVPATPVVRVV